MAAPQPDFERKVYKRNPDGSSSLKSTEKGNLQNATEEEVFGSPKKLEKPKATSAPKKKSQDYMDDPEEPYKGTKGTKADFRGMSIFELASKA